MVCINVANSQYSQIITGKKIPQIVHALTAQADSAHRKLLAWRDFAVYAQN
jgi:hypothetical protein